MRILLFTGKGGVGKTTTAAATALAAAGQGLRTVVMSTDPAHSLADSFGVELGDELSEVAPNCFAQQLDAQARMESSWFEIRDYLRGVFDWAGLDDIEAEELSVIPGLDEVFALGDIKAFDASGEWDALVVDCAPTAETIRFLSLPDILGWYMERLFPVGRRLTKLVGPVVAKMAGGVPVAGDEVFGATQRFYERLEGVKDLLTDASRSSVRLVVNPEKMVVAEARRTYTYLSLFGYPVDAVVVNRLLPDAIDDPWFASWRESQETHLKTIEEGFAPTPVLRAELAPHEIVGIERLTEFGAALYGDRSAAAVLHDGHPFRIDTWGDDHVMTIELPFASRDDLDVSQVDDELVVTVGPYRRALVLPDSLRRRPVTGAALSEGTLRVTFGHHGSDGRS
ncbi:MAG TPA: ArsA family ATPase [Acidimicrobiales bacterium]